MAEIENTQPNRDELMAMAEQAARENNKQGARMMFRQVLAEDPDNERALLWMVKLAANPGERRKWLERVVAVNPDNAQAQQALQKIEYRSSSSRNRLLFRLLAGAYVVAVLVIAIFMLVSISQQTL
jgi:thioredoxin-like negative regulator of GroEL